MTAADVHTHTDAANTRERVRTGLFILDIFKGRQKFLRLKKKGYIAQHFLLKVFFSHKQRIGNILQ